MKLNKTAAIVFLTIVSSLFFVAASKIQAQETGNANQVTLEQAEAMIANLKIQIQKLVEQMKSSNSITGTFTSGYVYSSSPALEACAAENESFTSYNRRCCAGLEKKMVGGCDTRGASCSSISYTCVKITPKCGAANEISADSNFVCCAGLTKQTKTMSCSAGSQDTCTPTTYYVCKSPDPVCGNSVCEWPENSFTCLSDCVPATSSTTAARASGTGSATAGSGSTTYFGTGLPGIPSRVTSINIAPMVSQLTTIQSQIGNIVTQMQQLGTTNNTVNGATR